MPSASMDDFVDRFDPIDPRAQVPYETYAAMRARCPVSWSDAHEDGYWVLSRYREVYSALRDHPRFSSAGGITMPKVANPRPMLPIEADPPLQLQYRALLASVFSPPSVARLEPTLRRQTRELVDQIASRDGCDLIVDYCERQPTIALWQEPFLGAPTPLAGDPDWVARVQSWVHDLAHVPEASAAAAQSIYEMLTQLLQDRRERPADDIPTRLLDASIDGRDLTEEERLDILFLLYSAGVETTAASLGAIFLHLAQFPEDREALVRRPELLPTAIEEFLRLLGPTQALKRTLTEDVEVGDVAMSAGQPVILLLGSADRDETEFEDAGRCRLDRFPNRHLGFGAGVHRCLGSNLARLELHLAIEELLARIPNFELAVDVTDLEWDVGIDRALRHLPVRY